MEIKRVSIPAIKLEDDCRLPKKIHYYTHDAFNVSILNSTVNRYGDREWKIAFDTKIETATGSMFANALLMNKLIKILPIDIKETFTYVESPRDVAEVLSDVLGRIDDDSVVSVFIHKDFFKIMKELEVDDISKFLSNYVSKEISETIRKDWSRAEIRNKLKDVFLELSTLMDVKCQAYLNSKYMSPITTYLLLDYLLTPFKSGSTSNNIKFFREMILALSRDMFYQTKIENVLGMLNYNKSNLGPLSWMVIDVLEKDKMNTNPIYAIEKLAHLGISNLWLTEKIGKLLYDKYEDYDTFCECTYGENFDGLSNAQVSQTTGLYLTQNPKTIASYSVPEDLKGNAIDQIDITIQKDSLRTMNYKKIASRIDKLEEDAMDIQNNEDKDSLLETAKFIASDIYDIQNQDENNYPEMDRLLTKLQEVITTINNAILGEPHDDLVPESEAKKRNILERAGHAIMFIPTAIIDRFKSLPDYKQYTDDEEREMDPQRRGKNRTNVFTRFFMGIEEIVDKCIPEITDTKIPLVRTQPTGRWYNQHLMNKMKRKERMNKRYVELRKASGYNTNYESFVEGFVHYGLMPFSENDIIGAIGNTVGGVVKGGQNLIQAGKNAWRWNALKKAFNEAEQAIEYIRVRSGADDHALRRLAMDHIKYWEAAAERIEDEGPETRELAKNIKKELNRFREKYANKIKMTDYDDPYSGYSRYGEIFNVAFENYMNRLQEDFDPNRNYEGEEMLNNKPYKENFIDDLFDGKKDKDYDNEIKKISSQMHDANNKDDMNKYYRLQSKRSLLQVREESKYYTSANKMANKWKKDTFYLAFFSPHENISRVIKIYENSPLSHVDIIYNGATLHAMGTNGLEELKLRGDHNLLVYEISDKLDKKKAIEFCEKTANAPFDMTPFYKGLIGINDPSDKYFCSKWVASLLDYAYKGTLTFKGKTLKYYGFNHFTPQDIFDMMMNTPGLVVNSSCKVFSNNKISSESYMDKLQEDYDPDKEYLDENGELPRNKVEQMTEFGDVEDSEEKEETVEELEDTILKKLRDRGALHDDDDQSEDTPYGEAFGGGKSKPAKSDSEKMNRLLQKDKEISAKMEEAKANDDMNKYWKLQDEKWQNWSYLEDMKAIPMGRMRDITKAGQPYIVFHRGATDFGKIITWWTKSPFSHTDVVIDNRAYSSFIDTLKVSVKLNPNASVVVYELSNLVDKRKFKQFLVEEGNKKYGLGELIKSQVLGIPTKDKAKFQAYFCSQYITAALDYATDRKLRYKGKPLLKWGYDYFNPKFLFYMLMSADGLLKNKTTLK